MTKAKANIPAVTHAAGLAGRAMARLEATATAIHEAGTARRARGFQAVSTKDGGFHATIRHDKTLIEISDSDFAITQTD